MRFVISFHIAHSPPPFSPLHQTCSHPLNIVLPLNSTLALQVIAAISLLDEGATVPFISRYRKEVTGGLDDTQLRNLEERLGYLRELEERRIAIVASIDEQGKLTPELRAEISNAETKAAP